MKAIRPAGQLVRAGVAIMLAAVGGFGCFSPLLAGIGGGTTLYQHETSSKPSSGASGADSSTKTKSKQNATAKADDSNLE